MPNRIQHKRSNTAYLVPLALLPGELAVNLSDKNLYCGDDLSTPFRVGGPANNYVLGANATFNGVDYGYGRRTLTGTSTQTVDSWPLAQWRTANYAVSIKDNVANNFHSAQVTMLYDGSDCRCATYGILFSNTYMGTFTGSANATHGLLQFTPISANTTLTISRTLLAI